MALTFNNTRVDLSDDQLPAGYTRPNITTFNNFEAKYTSIAFTVGKLGVDEAVAITTFDAILVSLNSQITTYLTNDLNTAAATITAYAILKTLRTNTEVDEVFYTTGAVNYLLVVDIFYKTA